MLINNHLNPHDGTNVGSSDKKKTNIFRDVSLLSHQTSRRISFKSSKWEVCIWISLASNNMRPHTCGGTPLKACAFCWPGGARITQSCTFSLIFTGFCAEVAAVRFCRNSQHLLNEIHFFSLKAKYLKSWNEVECCNRGLNLDFAACWWQMWSGLAVERLLLYVTRHGGKFYFFRAVMPE